MAEILLFGATGFTGRLVAKRLHDLGLPFAIAGRNRHKIQALAEQLGGVPTIVADAEQPHTLNDLARQTTRVLINCAGPFVRYGEPVVNVAVEGGIHYVDITGHQLWMKRMVNRYDGVALRGRVTVINGMAFEYAIGDWLASLAAGKLGRNLALDSISVGYTLAGSGISRGTARSIFELLGTRGWSYEGGRWRRRRAGWTSRDLPFPSGRKHVLWVPFGETVLVPRHERVQAVLTYLHTPAIYGKLSATVGRLLPLIRPLARPVVDRLVQQFPAGPDSEQRAMTRFAITAEARLGGQTTYATAVGSDPYGLTARIVVLAAEILLTQPVQRGVRAPAHLPIDPQKALEEIGVTLLA